MYFKNKKRITIMLPTKVMGQIASIVNHFDTEVSWFGDVTQEGDIIEITNVYLFPQVVTGGTFRTDTPQVSRLYDDWYEAKVNEMVDKAESLDKIKPIMQYNGHSHVHAACTASGEDQRYRASRDGLNIYSIHNKAGKSSWEVWTDDVVYEDADINVIYTDEIFSVAKEYVLKPEVASVTRHTPRYGGYYNQATPSKQKKTKAKSFVDMTDEEFEKYRESNMTDKEVEEFYKSEEKASVVCDYGAMTPEEIEELCEYWVEQSKVKCGY